MEISPSVSAPDLKPRGFVVVVVVVVVLCYEAQS